MTNLTFASLPLFLPSLHALKHPRSHYENCIHPQKFSSNSKVSRVLYVPMHVCVCVCVTFVMWLHRVIKTHFQWDRQWKLLCTLEAQALRIQCSSVKQSLLSLCLYWSPKLDAIQRHNIQNNMTHIEFWSVKWFTFSQMAVSRSMLAHACSHTTCQIKGSSLGNVVQLGTRNIFWHTLLSTLLVAWDSEYEGTNTEVIE